MSARCVICDHTVEDTKGLSACPKCGTTSIPSDPDDDVTVRLNWHELRILCCWAEFWANQNEATSAPTASMRQCIFSIVRRLEVQHPGKTPLTLGGELRQLQKTMPIETNFPIEEGFDPTAQ